ncbi:hypothetical protein Sme01_10080 [Sphaerisporangium melleum]|uniref:Uncharacterized protein n=1 Tax=Sphaerisporangium melleum TaxID=321316 RepID=A0A917QT51_9ACTN|nr:hypothetical protein [Sphaerisporangium melleum]GGK66970.1 hypothetical protein GCM10007964_07530 [Sphaerisporangium melleum]GII68532.1 hypothetical protein Sme01_10080 [Sphaerisporangium melleum]
MDADSMICLSDLVPALRWSRPQQIAEVLADPRLPGGWWASVALSRALGTTGVEWLCDRLSRLTVSRWDHLALTDVLPALQVHVVDPALPGWPEPARSAITGMGGIQRLRRLSPSDLRLPAAPAPEVIITALFREVLGRLPAVSTPMPQNGAAAPAVPHTTQHTGPHPAQPGVPAQGQPAGPAQGRPAVPYPGPPTGPQPGRPTGAYPAQPTGPYPAQPTGPQPAVNGAAPPYAEAPAAPAPGTPPPPPQAPVSDNPLVRLVDAVFREWTPLERAVAIERLFAEQPVSLRTLAHELHVDRDVLSQAQRAAEERVLQWLRSPESTAVTGHLFRLTEWLGVAATEDQLIGADPAHPIEVPSLGTPLWRVLVALMRDRRLQDGWLVVGDLSRLRERTAQMLGDRTSGEDAAELLAQVGIRAHSAQAWIDALPKAMTRAPQPSAATTTNGFAPLPRRTPGANGHQMRGGAPVPSVADNLPDAQTAQSALAALTALSAGPPRPHLVPEPRPASQAHRQSPASDPRRWQRIDVTPEHLRGEPVPVPEGYATQLGMRPGTLLSVTGPGDNAVVLVWRDRQPVFDSLQPVLMRLNARPGDSVYVTVDGYRLDAQLTS